MFGWLVCSELHKKGSGAAFSSEKDHHVPGHWDGHRVADLLGDLIADLAGRADIITDLKCISLV